MTLIAIVLKQGANPVFKELNAFFRKLRLVLLRGLIRLGNLNSLCSGLAMQQVVFPGIFFDDFPATMFDLFRWLEKDQALGRQLGPDPMSVL